MTDTTVLKERGDDMLKEYKPSEIKEEKELVKAEVRQLKDKLILQQQAIKAQKLPSIPGKSAPVTAGKIIAQTVIDTIKRKV